jgi:formylglycine-generating enzyme required for sulfatase activity
MTEQSQSHNLRAIRDCLVHAFNDEELKELFYFSENSALRNVGNQFLYGESLTAWVQKAVSYCERYDLLDELLAEIKDANPRAYARFEPELLIGGTELPREEETHPPIPEILTIASPVYLDLVRVPVGEFLMGSVAARDECAQEDELPPHSVRVPEFHIGLYPVTNLQYQAFMKAAEFYAPDTWESDEVPDGKGNHPVTGVGWREAVAFCSWLREGTGQPFRLPTEAEWEKAARGTDGRIYPWGDEPPHESRCNFGDQVGHTTSIGLYSPQGDSPYGCADMAGNVWEWCQSLYKPYPYRASDGREKLGRGIRVVRGGSWSARSAWIRCACRYTYGFDIGYNTGGFRVVVAPDPLLSGSL